MAIDPGILYCEICDRWKYGGLVVRSDIISGESGLALCERTDCDHPWTRERNVNRVLKTLAVYID